MLESLDSSYDWVPAKVGSDLVVHGRFLFDGICQCLTEATFLPPPQKQSVVYTLGVAASNHNDLESRPPEKTRSEVIPLQTTAELLPGQPYEVECGLPNQDTEQFHDAHPQS